MSLALVALGLVWSCTAHVYDLRSGQERLVVALIGLALSYVSMFASLAVARVALRERRRAALWGILPWNAVLLSQLAYVGYFFIPLEILASTLLLRRSATIGRGVAVSVAAVTRTIAFVATVTAAHAVRRLWPR